jgi:hypothetical protein
MVSILTGFYLSFGRTLPDSIGKEHRLMTYTALDNRKPESRLLDGLQALVHYG